MAYQAIQPAAFVPNPETEGLHAQIYTLNFPSSWRPPILELYKHGKSDRAQTKLQQVPIKRLNAIMRAVAPDLVAVDANASFDDTSPWLYSDAKFPPRAMESLINAWLRDMQPSPEAFPAVKKAKSELDLSALQWQDQDIDLLQHAISPGNTCLPESHLFRLLPEILATRIEQLAPYEHCGSPVPFIRVAVDARAKGAELMSWPPQPHQSTNKDGTARTWHYSAVINLSLRTVPFSPIPRIYLSTSIRRWVTGRIWIPAKGSVSTYLLTTKSFLPDGPDPHRFAVARLAYDYKTSKTQWAQGGPEGMLVQVKALENLPTADVFVKEPEAWLKGRGGVIAGAAYHTRMGWHEVGAGIMPTERRRLFEWASQALEPEFKPIDEFRRSSVKPGRPGRILEKPAPVSKKATDDERAAQVEENEQVHARNAVHRRTCVAAAVGERGLTVFALYQTDTMLSHLIKAAEVSLCLADHRLETGPTTWSWNTPDLTLRIHARQLGALGAPLGEDSSPRRGEDFDQAISARRAEVTASLSLLSSDVHDTAQITFVELEGADQFKKTRTDPKFAIRLGCADAGTVSQFLQPPNSAKREENAAFRAAAGWEDGLRQVGMRLTPEHTLGTAIPDGLNQLAFWLVKRRVDSQTNQAQFTPVAILVRPGQQCIMGKTSDMAEWVPYPDLLKGLTGKIRPDELKTTEQQTEAAAAFFKKTLYALRDKPTVAVFHAQNTRDRFPWLTNSGLVQDKIQIGSGPLQRLSLHGKQLRAIRIATSDRDETPKWWAPKPDGRGGLAKGLWTTTQPDEGSRVFYSTIEGSGTHKVSRDATKLTPHLNSNGQAEINPDVSAWNPELLEFTMVGLQPHDEAEQWAMYLHQQRFPDDYPSGLGLPLILHLAQLTSEYGLPHEQIDQAEAPTEETATE